MKDKLFIHLNVNVGDNTGHDKLLLINCYLLLPGIIRNGGCKVGCSGVCGVFPPDSKVSLKIKFWEEL
jgi:hypothetical protein